MESRNSFSIETCKNVIIEQKLSGEVTLFVDESLLYSFTTYCFLETIKKRTLMFKKFLLQKYFLIYFFGKKHVVLPNREVKKIQLK